MRTPCFLKPALVYFINSFKKTKQWKKRILMRRRA